MINSNAAILIAIALNLLALFYRFFPPKQINKLYGYHMKSSTKNQDTWREANSYAARLMLLLSILFLLASLLTETLVKFNSVKLIIFAAIIVGSVAALYFLTEKHMKNVFDENGKRK